MIWWLKRVKYLQRKCHCQWTLLRGKQPKCFSHNFGYLVQPLEFAPISRERVVTTEWQVRTVLGDYISKAKVISVQAPQYRHVALISNFLDLANLSFKLEHWPRIRSRTDLKGWNIALATITGPALRSYPENMTADVQHALEKCESLGSRKNGPSPGIHRQLQSIYPRIWQFFDDIFPEYAVWVLCGFSKALGEANLTFLLPSVKPLLGHLSGKTVQDQLAWGFVLQPNSISLVPHLIRASGLWLYAGKKVWDVSPSWLHLRTKEEITPIIRLHQTLLSLMILKFHLVHKVHNLGRLLKPHQPSGPARSAWYTAMLACSTITSRWQRKSWDRIYNAWAITPASATFTPQPQLTPNTNEWWRRWWWSATTGREANTTV